MLVYVDDCLAVHHDPGPVMEDLKSCYKLKNDMYGEPKRYLGEDVENISNHITGGNLIGAYMVMIML